MIATIDPLHALTLTSHSAPLVASTSTDQFGVQAASNFTGRVDMLFIVSDPQLNFTGLYDYKRVSLTVLGNGCTYTLSTTNISAAAAGTAGPGFGNASPGNRHAICIHICALD